jgi:hypothetical protein
MVARYKIPAVRRIGQARDDRKVVGMTIEADREVLEAGCDDDVRWL